MSQSTLIALPAESQPFYIHRPLVELKSNFRLLELRPALWGDGTICGTLKATLTDGQTQYVALSYEWGPANDYDLIEVDDTPFRIRRNLFNCLGQYSKRIDRPAYLFVDAICIDQSNTEERAAQVAVMGTIFQEAREVFIWLGVDDSSCTALFHMASPNAQIVEVLADGERCAQSQMHADRYNRALLAVRTSDLKLAANLFEDASVSYWSRAWVFQEILLARQISLNCGSLHATWEEVAVKIRGLGQHDGPALHEHSFRAMDKVLQLHRRRSPEPLSALLYDYMYEMRDKGCADVRDRFYGVLGLFDELNEVEVSYEHTTSQVFLEALSYGIRIGAINENPGGGLGKAVADLICHFHAAFNLQQQVQLTFNQYSSEPCDTPNVAEAELHFMLEDTASFTSFARKLNSLARSWDNFDTRTISRGDFEKWKESPELAFRNRFPSIVLFDESSDGVAIFIWLRRMSVGLAMSMTSSQPRGV